MSILIVDLQERGSINFMKCCLILLGNKIPITETKLFLLTTVKKKKSAVIFIIDLIWNVHTVLLY